MNINIICIGKTTDAFVKEGISLYLSRIKHFCGINIIELPEVKNSSTNNKEFLLKKEEELLLKILYQHTHVVLLDEKGLLFNSTEFSRYVEKKQNSGCKTLTLVIGGAYGFSENIHNLYKEKIALSQMTFTHQMVRLFLTEQLYRAFTIIKNIPYHN
ncbi:MAG: 23S rRNA (pseudouridine(1915)-N(3))-methyltransferase RlmH [Bacteroidales bacterium]|nr:23S rRNA (pseudouridine(1915)-N(3))-methyltransferase RlmH [Bacteroidales bacterium]